MTTALMTPFVPGAGPPPTRMPTRLIDIRLESRPNVTDAAGGLSYTLPEPPFADGAAVIAGAALVVLVVPMMLGARRLAILALVEPPAERARQSAAQPRAPAVRVRVCGRASAMRQGRLLNSRCDVAAHVAEAVAELFGRHVARACQLLDRRRVREVRRFESDHV